MLAPRALEDAAEAAAVRLLLVLGVVTTTSRIARRKLMRETAFANASRAVSIYFVIGRDSAAFDKRRRAALAAERAAHGDLLELDAEERGLSFKVLV